MTLAVCSRTSPHNLQVLRRFSQKVYATPSRRNMKEGKGETEEMTYPHISFAIDNFEDMFDDVVVRDGESLGIELTACDHAGRINVVLFSASVPYEAMKRVYDSRQEKDLDSPFLSFAFAIGRNKCDEHSELFQFHVISISICSYAKLQIAPKRIEYILDSD